MLPGPGNGVSSPSGVPQPPRVLMLCSQMTSPAIENPACTVQVCHFTHFCTILCGPTGAPGARGPISSSGDAAFLPNYCGHCITLCKEQCQVHAGEEGHARPGWTTPRRGQDSTWKSQSERQRTGINGESTSIHRGRLKNKTEQNCGD